MSLRAPLLFLSIFASFLLSGGVLRAADSSDDREAKEAADEESAEKQLSEEAQNGKSYSGRFTLDINDKQPRDVIGSFATDTSATYLVKVSDQALMKRMIARDNQKCMLFGKLRNKGKYLVVTSIVEPAPTPLDHHKRGGM
jgi:hypothetical protein